MKNTTQDNAVLRTTLLLALAYGLSLYFIQFLLVRIGWASQVPSSVSLLRYDAGIYQDISKNGYSFPDDHRNNTGAYILFPWLWNLLHVGVVGISIVNILLFSIGFSITCYLYPVTNTTKILWLTTPSLYFMVVPYTEALFCVLTALSFYGIATQKRWLIWASLFLLSLTRATAIFLIPSLLIMELLTNDRKFAFKSLGSYLLHYALPVMAGLAVFVCFQYYKTGIWFVYYKQQIKHLGHEWSLPRLPFQNCYEGLRYLWLNAFAMLVCIVALVFLMQYAYKWLVRNRKSNDKIMILALSYLPVVLFCIVFCNPKWGERNTTNLFGLHRYTFATPYIFVFLHKVINGVKRYSRFNFISILLLCNLVWLSMGSYIHLQLWLYWNILTLFILGYMLYSNTKNKWIAYVLIAVNCCIQVTLYQHFLNNIYTE